MRDKFSSLPVPDSRTALAILGVICLLVVPTGAVLYNEADSIGQDDQIILAPADGSNGNYAQIDADRQLTINITEAGVNPDARTDIKRVFTITNTKDTQTQVWLTHTNEDAVTFYDDSTGEPIAEDDEVLLEKDDQVVVSMRVDTTGSSVTSGQTLVTKLYVHTRSFKPSTAIIDIDDEVSFGNVTVGENETRSVDVHNEGNETLTFSNLSVSGANASAFAVLNADSLPSIEPNETKSLTVEFSPTTTGPHAANISFETNASNAETVTLNATGTGVPHALEVVSSSPLDFGSVAPNTTETRNLTVRNTGSDPLTIGAFELAGTNPDDFDVGTDTPVTIQPGEKLDVSVSFTPSATGERTADLDLEATDGTLLAEVSLVGRGDVTSVTASPESVDFGSIGKGNSTEANVTLTSNGTKPISVSVVGFGGADAGQFDVNTSGFPTVLAPGETVTVPLNYSPDEAANHTAILTLDTNGTSSQTVTVPVEGEGLPPEIGVGDENLDFGNVTPGSSRSLNITVWNEETSPADLTVTQTILVGANPESFEVIGGEAPFTLAPGDEQDIRVKYSPEENGIKTAQLRILSDAGNMPQIDVWMSNAGWRIRVQQVGSSSKGVDGDDEEFSLDPRIVNSDAVRVELDADDVPEAMQIDVNVSQPRTRDAAAGIDEIRMRTNQAGSFDLNFIHHTGPPTTGSPDYDAPADRSTVQHVTLWHSIPNANIEKPTITYRVRKSALADGIDPGEVEFRRYVDGEWTHPESEFLRETGNHYVFKVDLPGLSEFVITGPKDGGSDDEDDTPTEDDDDSDDDSDDDDTDDDDSDEEPSEPSGPTVTDGNTTITFEDANDSANVGDSVSVTELPVPEPEVGRDGPKADISAAIDTSGGVSIQTGNADVKVSIRSEPRYLDAIKARGADAMTIVNQPLPLTASHSLFGSKESIDDHWRMIRQLEITVPAEYENSPATLRIRVPKSAFADTDPEDAVLARQHDGWQLLDTQIVDETPTHVVMQAQTPGFSVFAIFADNKVSYEWEVETYDEPLHGVTIEPTFDEIGMYNATLTVTDSFGLTDTAHYRILANDVPKVTIEQASPMTPNATATLVANVDDELGNVTILWRFPDGTTKTGRVVEHEFSAGVQTVEVTATDEFGAQGTTGRQFIVGGIGALDVQDLSALVPAITDPIWLVVLLVLLILGLLWRFRAILLVPVGHDPKISRVSRSLLELDRDRVVLPELHVTDRGDDLESFSVALERADGQTIATGTGTIESGGEFDATSIVLRLASGVELSREEQYSVVVSVTDEAGGTTTRTVDLEMDPFVYPHAHTDEEQASTESFSGGAAGGD